MARKVDTKDFITRAQEVHGVDRYDYSLVKYVSAKDKVDIKCNECEIIFPQLPNNHLAGRGCSNCAKIKSAKKRSNSQKGKKHIKKTTNQFITDAVLKHKNQYDYIDTVYNGSFEEVNIKCNICNINFDVIAANHLTGQGCPNCSSKKRTTEEFISEANIFHKGKYNYSKTIYTGCKNEVIIICNICNLEFNQIADNHLQGKGCKNCANILSAKIRKKSSSKFIDEAISIHKNRYDYSYVNDNSYKNEHTNILLKCNICMCIFPQTPANHLRGDGCPKCSKRISISETKWLDYLNISLDNRQVKLTINKKYYKVDAYDPTTNTIYEFYGDYWHGNPKKYNSNDFNKKVKKTFGQLYKEIIQRENTFKLAGYKIISIWEYDWKKQCQEKK